MKVTKGAGTTPFRTASETIQGDGNREEVLEEGRILYSEDKTEAMILIVISVRCYIFIFTNQILLISKIYEENFLKHAVFTYVIHTYFYLMLLGAVHK